MYTPPHTEPNPNRSAEEAEIRGLLAKMRESWDKNDATAYASVFTEDSDYIAFDGTHLRGRQANEELHASLFKGILQKTRLSFEGDPQIRFLSPDVAVVHAKGAVLLPWQRRIAPSRRSIQTYVAVKREGRWWFTAFQNTRIRPVPTKGFALKMITALFRARTALSRRR